MKNIKKFSGGFIAFLFILVSVSQTVFSASIIDTERPGSINIKKFAVENMEDYNIPAVGEEQVVDHAIPLPNIRFTVTRVQDDATNPAEAVALEGGEAYSKTIPTGADGLAEFIGLTLGTYLVHEEESTAVEEPVEDFLVQVPMTNENGTKWIYDVFVYPKNRLAGQPEITVSVEELNNRYAPADNGSDVKWILSSDSTKGIATALQYEISVMLDPYLEYLEGSENIYYKNAQEVYIPLEAGIDYSVDGSSQLVKISILEQGRRKLAEAEQAEGVLPQLYTEMRTRFYANAETLPEIMGTEITLTAELEYVNELGVGRVFRDDEGAYIYTGGLNLLKEDSKTGKLLEGARFRIYRTLEDAIAGNNAILEPDGSEAWEATSKINGEAGFYGLAYGVRGEALQEGKSIYYLVEVQAPAGYNLLTAPEKAEVNYASHMAGNHLRIDNRSGFTLPATGGVGTIIFTLTGIILLILALWLYRMVNRTRYEK